MAKKTVAKKGWKDNPAVAKAVAGIQAAPEWASSLAAIQMLVPAGLAAVNEQLQKDLLALAGCKHQRDGVGYRWGSNDGSIFLGDQKARVKVPRVRSKADDQEIPLPSYARLQNPRSVENVILRRVIAGISGGRYEEAALLVPETFGVSRSSVSKKYIRASGRKLRTFQTRSLKGMDIVAVLMDGKTFGDSGVIIALGVTIKGEKVVLGFIEASTEKYEVCRDFLNSLVGRGLSVDQEMLVVIDGGKGLRKAVGVVLGDKAFVQRCQFHKRENVVSYLPRTMQDDWSRKIQGAYERPTYGEAKTRLNALRRELKRINASAAASLAEGMEETLTLHKLGLFEELGVSFKTTNLIETVNSQLEQRTGRVSRWRNSDQRHRWVGTSLLDIEDGFRKIKGHKHLPALREAMRTARIENQEMELQKAA